MAWGWSLDATYYIQWEEKKKMFMYPCTWYDMQYSTAPRIPDSSFRRQQKHGLYSTP